MKKTTESGNLSAQISGHLGTDHVVLNKALLESGELYRSIVHASPDDITISDIEGRIIMTSPTALDMFGYSSEEELIGSNIMDFITPEDRERAMGNISHVLSGATTGPVEYTGIRKDGSTFDIEVNGGFVLGEDGRPIKMVFIIRDITERKLSHQLLKSSQRQLQDIIEFLPDATLAIDRDKRVIIWNKAIEKMTGIPASEMIGKGDYAYTIPFYGDARGQFMDLVFSYDDAIASRYKNLKRDGDTLMAEVFCPAMYDNKGAWIFVKVAPLHDQTGNVVGVIEIIRDITDRKQADETILKSEAKYRQIFENAPLGILHFNQDGVIEDCNENFVKIIGSTKADLINMNMLKLPDSKLTNALKETLNGHLAIYEGNYKSVTADKVTPVRVLFTPIKSAEGIVEAGVGIIEDITPRKKREEEIEYLSYHDQLTGLYNRRFYEEELIRLDTERNLPLSIAMGDVNGLKLINDSFGHAAGDAYLMKVAEVIKRGCRADDIIARLGGDEFVILLPRTNAFEAERVINRIRNLSLKEQSGAINMSISFGFETKTEVSENIQEILKRTEDHMYRHKLYENLSMRSKTIDLIMNTLYEKNNREMLHSKRVSELCETIASIIYFDKDEINQVRIAGLMHDIGKIGIDEEILNKANQLNAEEWGEIKRHPEIGYRILSSVNEFSEIAGYVLEHQERWDGKGYPRGLRGEAISLQARIIAVADAYDAMTSYRTYGRVLDEDHAVIEIKKYASLQFDPEIARIFVEKVLKKAW